MAYTNGIFYIDLVSGSDTARTALTSCTASNPSGSVTRINKTGHGLVTGAVVDLTLFSTWLNDAWKITVVDADNFDLDGAVWQSTADASGTVTPRGGSSWSDAWLTTTSGATAARIQPGDTIRYNKQSVQSAGVNATFTSGSKNITLSSALTKTIEDGVSGWTPSANITGSTNATRKIGSSATVMTPAAGFTTGKVCYKAIAGGGTQDFSGYTKISFWFRPNTAAIIAANTYKICLCSDTTGDTIVNELNIPATISSNAFHIMVLDYGAALGSSIQSVAIYANSDPGTTAFSFSNIVAANDVTHQTLIGWQDDCYYNVQAFSGTTVTIDSLNNAVGGQGWYGTTGTAGLYYCNPVASYLATTVNVVNDSGSVAGGYITFSGGWDTGTNTRNGMTYFASNVHSSGVAFSGATFVKMENFVIARFSSCISIASAQKFIAENIVFASSASAISSSANLAQLFYMCKFLNGSVILNAGNRILSCYFLNGTGRGLTIAGPTNIANSVFGNNANASLYVSNTTASLYEEYGHHSVIRDTLFADSTEVEFSNSYGYAWSLNHDQTLGNNWGFTNGATINWQTSTVHDTEPGAWRVVHSSSNKGVLYPVRFKIGEFAVTEDTAVTFTAWVKKDHATNVACRIVCEGPTYSLPGITDTSDTKADDTSWEQLSITFTPTESGIVPIYFESWYVAGNSSTYIGSVTCTQ